MHRPARAVNLFMYLNNLTMNKNVFLDYESETRKSQVYLRPFSETDVPFLANAINDQRLRPFLLSAIFPNNELTESDWIRRQYGRDNRSSISLGIVLKTGNELIGSMGLHHIDHLHGTATTGAWIVPEHQRKGYGTEAKMLVLRWAFLDLNLRKISSSAFAFNKASIRFNEKCGYRREAILKKQFFCNGRHVDDVISAVFKPAWQKAWTAWERGDNA